MSGAPAAATAPDGAANEPIPLARPSIGEREAELVLATLRSGQLSLGPRLGEFEEAFAARLGVEHASAVSSGTAGLHLALRAAGVKAGDDVVTTPLSFVASANAIVYEGARPVFCDIDPHTLNLDPEAAAAAVGPRTRGILPVHIFGQPADLPAFERIAAQHGLFFVEDACEALGAQHADGTPVGARGNLAVFGFYPNKQLTTGEGGMVVCPDAETKARIDSERNQGRAPDMGWLDHDRLGFNYRLSDLACALGVAQLERLEDLLAARRSLAAAYDERLGAPYRPAALGRSRRGYRRAPRPRRRLEAVPARDPPHDLLPRALRSPRGRAAGVRGRRPPLARAAVLPRSARGRGRPRLRRARGGGSRSGARPCLKLKALPSE